LLNDTYFVCKLQSVPSEYEPAGQSLQTVSLNSVPINTQRYKVFKFQLHSNKVRDRSHVSLWHHYSVQCLAHTKCIITWPTNNLLHHNSI